MTTLRVTRSSALGSKALQSLRPDKFESVCLAFGIAWADVQRLNAFADMYPDTHVVASSDSTSTDESLQPYGEFRRSEFSSVSGFLSTLRPNTTFVCIDWYFLGKSYYQNRYGLNWIDKALRAFVQCPALQLVLLPRYGSDGSDGGKESFDETFDTMIRTGVSRLLAAGLGVSTLTYRRQKRLCPLCVRQKHGVTLFMPHQWIQRTRHTKKRAEFF